MLDEDDDFCSNWRDLYTACELKPGAEEKAACHAGGPSYCILKAWKRRSGSLATIGRLIELLTDIKRLDAVDMITEQFELKSEGKSGRLTESRNVESPLNFYRNCNGSFVVRRACISNNPSECIYMGSSEYTYFAWTSCTVIQDGTDEVSDQSRNYKEFKQSVCQLQTKSFSGGIWL